MRIFLVVIIAIVAATGAVYFLLENPDRFKDQITGVVESNTDYEVTIAGDFSWRYWPPIAINATEIRIAQNGQDFATFESLSVDVDLIPVLTRQPVIDVNDLTLSGGNIRLTVDQQGKENWLPDAKPPTNTADNEQSSLTSSVARLQINDVAVRYLDLQNDTDVELRIASLTTSALASDKPFDLSFTGTLIDHLESLEADIASSGRMSFQSDTGRVIFQDLLTIVDAVYEQARYPTVTLTSEGQWRPEENAILLRRNDFQISALRGAMTGIVSLRGDTPKFDGVLEVESADAQELARVLDLSLPVSFFQFTSDFGATTEVINFRTLEGIVDQSNVKGAASITLESPMRIAGELRVDSLTLASPDTSSPPQSSNQRSIEPDDSELIPVDLLADLETALTLRLATLTYEGDRFDDVKVTLSSTAQNLDVIANASAFGGKMVIASNTDLGGETTTNARITLDKLAVSNLTQMQGITGSLTGNAELTFTGHLLSDLNESLTGKSVFTVKDGSLDVRPLKSLARTIDVLRGKTSSVSQWPDIMPFDNMQGQHLFSNGTRGGQLLNASVENLNITAMGGVDLLNNTMDYDVIAMFGNAENAFFKVSDQITGIRWPLTCQGPLDETFADLCFGRDNAIQALVNDIVTQDVKRRGNEKLEEFIQDKVPEAYRELTNDLFKNLFK